MQEAVGTAMHSAWCHMPTAASVTEHGAPEVGCWGSAQDLSSLVRAQVTMHSPLPWPATALCPSLAVVGSDTVDSGTCSSAFAGWEVHTRGIGSRLLTKMGYEFGKGEYKRPWRSGQRLQHSPGPAAIRFPASGSHQVPGVPQPSGSWGSRSHQIPGVPQPSGSGGPAAIRFLGVP